MAATVKIIAHGNTTFEGLELENFATEDSLSELLKQFTTFSSKFDSNQNTSQKQETKSQTLLEKITTALTGGVAGATAAKVDTSQIRSNVSKLLEPALKMFVPFSGLLGNMISMTPEILAATAAFKIVSISLRAFQETLNFISRGISSIFLISGSFVNSIVSGKLALNDYTTAIQNGTKSIPIIGLFTQLLNEATTILVNWNNSLYDLVSIGANFNGSISSLVIGAADAGLSVDQFSKIVRDNVNSFATFGSIMNGVNTYTRVTRITMSDYSDQLAALGISFAQYSTELPRILGLFGAAAKAHGASDKDLAESAIELTKNFDAMAQLTGKTRDQQAADLEKLQTDAAWQQKIAGMNKDQQEKYIQVMNQLTQVNGEEYAQIFKTISLGMLPFDKNLQAILATTPGLEQGFHRMISAADSGTKGIQFQQQLNSISADMIQNAVNSGQDFSTAIKAASAGMAGVGADISKPLAYMMSHVQQFMENGVFNKAKYLEYMNTEAKRMTAENEISDNLSKFSNIIIVLREQIYENVIGPLANRIGPVLQKIIEQFKNHAGPLQKIMNTLTNLSDNFGKWIDKNSNKFGDWIGNFIDTVIKASIIFIDVIKLAYGITKFIIDNWGWIKWLLGVFAASVVLITGILGLKGLMLVLPLVTAGLHDFGFTLGSGVKLLKNLFGSEGIGSIVKKLAGGGSLLGKGAELTSIAGAGEIAETAVATEGGGAIASMLGLGAGEAAGAGALMAGEAAIPGPGWIALGVTAATLAGGAIWKHFSDQKKKEEDEKKRTPEAESLMRSHENQTNNLNDISSILQRMERHMANMDDSSSAGAKYQRQTRDALY